MIALIDSGVGGVSILAKCAKVLPYDYVLLVDNKNAPYGNKTKKQLLNITKNNIDFLIKRYKLEAIIFACNTLSFSIYNEIKSMYNIPIYKMEFDEKEIDKQNKKILFFATKNTIKYNKKIITKNGWKSLYIRDLPLFIDNNINRLYKTKIILNKKLNYYKNFNINTIVLGCTHFSLIKKQIKDVMPNVKIFEYENIVVNKIKNSFKPKDHRTLKILLTRYDYVRLIELKSVLCKLLYN